MMNIVQKMEDIPQILYNLCNIYAWIKVLKVLQSTENVMLIKTKF